MKGADGQMSGTGERAPKGTKTVCVLTPELAEPTTTPRISSFSHSCLDRESDTLKSDSAGTQASRAPPSCLRGRRKRRRLRVWFQTPPSQVLFSSDEQAVPLGEEECEENIVYQDQGGAG